MEGGVQVPGVGHKQGPNPGDEEGVEGDGKAGSASKRTVRRWCKSCKQAAADAQQQPIGGEGELAVEDACHKAAPQKGQHQARSFRLVILSFQRMAERITTKVGAV